MGATVSRIAIPGIAGPVSGDGLARASKWIGNRPSGQLWERVAETPSNAPAPLTVRQDEGIVAAYEAMRIARGPLARDPYGPAPRNGALGGIIRAGQRVR